MKETEEEKKELPKESEETETEKLIAKEESEEAETTEELKEIEEEIKEEAEIIGEPKEAEEVAEEEEKEVEKVEEEVEEEAAPTEEVEKAEEEVSLRRREEIPEEEIVEERIYTIPLRDAWRSPRKHRTPRAIRLIRSFIQRHMKVGLKAGLEEEEEEEEGRLIISNEVNEWVWRRGIEKPPRKIRVRAVKDRDGNVTVYLAEGD